MVGWKIVWEVEKQRGSGAAQGAGLTSLVWDFQDRAPGRVRDVIFIEFLGA